MASSLQAGSVAIQIIGNNNQFQSVIEQSQKSLRKFSGAVQSVKIPGFQGAMAYFRDFSMTFAAIGPAIRNFVINPLRSAITEFASFGDKFAKMSQRTGIGAEELSLLGYAAGQSGASVEELGNGMRVFQKNFAAAMRGNKSSLELFDRLGIDFQKFQKLSKTDQFLAVSEAVRRIGDETLQADAAMKMFGKGGTALLPMFQEGAEGIGKLMNEAKEFGIGINDEDAQKAVVLGDAIDRIKQSTQGLKNAIVSSLAKPLSTVLDVGSRWVKSAKDFIDRNQWIAKSFVLIAASASVAVGGLFAWRGLSTVFGPLLNILRSFGGTLLRLLPAVISFASPWGLVRLAVMGVIGAFGYFTGAGSKLLGWIGGFTATIKSIFFSAFGDITALVQQNRIGDAVQLMWLKIQLLFEQGKLRIVNTFWELIAAITEPFNAVYSTVSSVLAPLWEWVTETASQAAAFICDAWNQRMGWLGELLGTWWSYIRGGWDALQNDLGAVIVGGWWSIATGINSAIAFIRQIWNDLITGIQTSWLSAGKRISQGIGWIVAKISGLNPNEVMADIERQYDVKIQGVQDRSAAKEVGIEASRKGMQDYLDDTAAKSINRIDQEKQNAPKSNERIDQLKFQIAELKNSPITSNQETASSISESIKDVLGDPNLNPDASKSSSKASGGKAGTFSAFEMGAVRGNMIEDTLKTQAKLQQTGNGILDKIYRELEESNEFA